MREKEPVYRAENMSEETRRWIRRRRKRNSAIALVSLVASLAVIIGYRDPIADQFDWFDRAIHGPTELFIMQSEVSTMTNRMNTIDFRLSRIERKLNIEPLGADLRTNAAPFAVVEAKSPDWTFALVLSHLRYMPP